jgi:hypothetical protein
MSLEHINSSGCCIKSSEGKGRGVYGELVANNWPVILFINYQHLNVATRIILAQTVIEISPILYFSKEEYKTHGKYTILDHYTFKCRDGRMALALGLGTVHSLLCIYGCRFAYDRSMNKRVDIQPLWKSECVILCRRHHRLDSLYDHASS